MSRRKIGQEELMFTGPAAPRRSSLDELTCLIDWAPVAQQLDDIHSAAKGEPAWPPLALFKALLIAVWYDLSDVKLAEALAMAVSLTCSVAFNSRAIAYAADHSCASMSRRSSRSGSGPAARCNSSSSAAATSAAPCS